MRPIGTALMGFGGFFISVALASILGPWLQSLGIDVRAETTSLIGTALIGVFAFATGMLLRRRAIDTERSARAVEGRGTVGRGQLGEGAADPRPVPRADRVPERRGDSDPGV